MVMEYRAVGLSGADSGRPWVRASRADILAAVDESLRYLGHSNFAGAAAGPW
jgi:hypothetical protein